MGYAGKIKVTVAAGILAVIGLAQSTSAEPSYAISMYGTPALPPDFVSLPYANQE